MLSAKNIYFKIIICKGCFDEEETHELLDSVAYWADVVFLLYRYLLLPWMILMMVMMVTMVIMVTMRIMTMILMTTMILLVQCDGIRLLRASECSSKIHADDGQQPKHGIFHHHLHCHHDHCHHHHHHCHILIRHRHSHHT